MNITKTLWTSTGDATKAYDEQGYHCSPRLLSLMMSLNENGITVNRTGNCDGFSIYAVTADERVWDEWESQLKQEGFL